MVLEHMPRRLFLPLLLSILGLPLAHLTAEPHGGGLDTYGCHNDRKHGDYHCHKGPLPVSHTPHSKTCLSRSKHFRRRRRQQAGRRL